jgi:DNA-binding transcriptional LysR family regulator
MTDVAVVELPPEIKGFSYFMVWHPRLSTEAEHAWFRDHLRLAAGSIRR